MHNPVIRYVACLAAIAAISGGALASAQGPATGKIPVSTSSDEARQLYLKGRDLAEKLRATDARKYFEQAAARDPSFALAHLGLANTSGTTKDFIESTTRAAALAGQASEGERHMVLAVEAGMKGDPAGVLSHYTELVKLFPSDERAHTLLANNFFGRQDYPSAVTHFVKATTINPSFSQPYNQLGYAYRFLEQYDKAEQAFKKYTELIPDDPNPYDSYAELLMKIGRFDESIAMYGKALAIDPNFVASHIGIGNNYLAQAQTEKARASFTKLASVARTTGERRQARFWMAASYVYDGATDKAIAELKGEYALAEAEHDGASMSADLTLMGDVLREAGRPDEALAKYNEALATIEKATVPEEVKAATRRNHLFEQARVAVAKNDIAGARARAAEYTQQVEPKKRPFEIRQQHELAGMIALAEKQYAAAVKELGQASLRDPRVLYLTALAHKGAGDTAKAAAMAAKAAKFNELSFNSAYVKAKAAKMTGSSVP
jgi:tetratricopeptide (TPR) repeat protein